MFEQIAAVGPARVAGVAVVALVLLSDPARADVLFQRQFEYSHTRDVQPRDPLVGPVEFTWAAFAMQAPTPFPQPPYPGLVFDSLTLSSETVGQTFRLLPGDDPDFGTYESFLTNGREDWLYATRSYLNRGVPPGSLELLGRDTGGSPERGYLGRLPTEPVDLAGFDITALSVRHDGFDITRGDIPVINVDLTFTIEGTPVPEPAAAVLALAGPALLLMRRRR